MTAGRSSVENLILKNTNDHIITEKSSNVIIVEKVSTGKAHFGAIPRNIARKGNKCYINPLRNYQ